MCGVSAYVARHDASAALRASLQATQHRGPDHQAAAAWQSPDGWHVGLGHNRLSIIDLSPSGHQPMLSSDGRVAMVFNGEIYNFRDLRHASPDVTWRGQSDSEVLLELYTRLGPDAFAQLRGMFAAVFYHVGTSRVVVVRDQLGIKPVYYRADRDWLAVSSEMRGLRALQRGATWRVDRDALLEFLNMGFVYDPGTGVAGVQKVPSGHYLVWEGGEWALQRYFSLDKATQGGATAEPAALVRAVESHLVSDAQIGLLFSGGMDSTALAVAARLPLLFARYDAEAIRASGSVDEYPFARGIAEHLGLEMQVDDTTARAGAADFLASVDATAIGNEELISDYTFTSSQALCAAARARGFKVMLSGMGADEAYLGYPRYALLRHRRLLSATAAMAPAAAFRVLGRRPSLAKKVERFRAFFDEVPLAVAYGRLVGYLSHDEIDALMGHETHRWAEYAGRLTGHLRGFEADEPLVQVAALDVPGFLAHNLTVADKSSMQESVELRVPFVDLDLYTGLLREYRQLAQARRRGKRPLRSYVESAVPLALMRRPKVGFNPPLDAHVAALGEMRVLETLRDGPFASALDMSAAERIVSAHFSGAGNQTYKVWQLLYLSRWLKRLGT